MNHRALALALSLVTGAALVACRHESSRSAAGFDAGVPVRERAGSLPSATGPDKAFEWRRLAWMDEHGNIAPGALARALEQREDNIAAAKAGGQRATAGIYPTAWTSRGPANIGGRTRALVVHPTQTNKLWAGSVSGGIWHSTDGGLNWSPVDDGLPNLAICSLAIAPSDPSIMYAGTGEGFFNGDAIGGIGIYKSTDVGATWSHLPSTTGWDNVCSIDIAPTNPNRILVGKRYGGIQRSNDGGATWTNPWWAQGGFQVVFHPTLNSTALATIIDYNFGTGEWFHRVLYTTNGGTNWSIASGLDYKPGFSSRIALAYHRANPSIIYATCGADSKMYKSTDGGHSFTAVTTSGTTDTDWYRAPIWVDPFNPSIVLAGAYHIKRSTDGGASFSQISNGYINTTDPHPDIHTFITDPGFNGTTNKRVYVCTDGAVYRTDDIYAANQNSGWTRLDKTYRTTQFYGAAGHGPSGKLYGGTQDNGSLLIQNGSDNATLPFGGDGGFCAIDWTNTNYMYGEYINLQIHRSKDGGASAQYITNGLTDSGSAANFIAPFILDPNNSNRMLAGGASLWRSNNVRTALLNPSWNAIRAPGSSYISAIAVAPGNSNIIYVAQNDAKIQKTTNGTAASPAWTDIDNNGSVNPLPDRYVTRIVVDPVDQDTVYVALGGFSPDNLWRSTDGGATWQDITGAGPTGLPDAPIRGVARHPSRRGWIYVGTEVGVFASADGGATWSTGSEGTNAASVDELVFMHSSTTLLSATHGRGLWTAPTATCPADVNGDGFVTGDDFDFFAALFVLGDTSADFNSDGFVTGDDFDAFADSFVGGC